MDTPRDEIQRPSYALPTNLIIPGLLNKDWRDYQKEIISDCWEAFNTGHTRIYYKLTVAGGKTITSAAIAHNFLREGLPVLWLAHNMKLLKQAEDEFKKFGWIPLQEQGNNDARFKFVRGDSRLVVGSVASLRGDRLKRWERDAFALIVYDECDLSLAPKNVDIINHFNAARLLGMTGTDDRGDGKNLGSLYQKRILSLNLKEATEKEMTVPTLRNKISVDPHIDLRNLKLRAGDFDEGELGVIVKEQSEYICSAISQDRENGSGIGNRPSLVFCPDIQSAEVIAENLNKFGISARALHSKMSDADRRAGEDDFVAGKYQVLVNALAYTVGTDFPFVSCIVLLRPTRVRRLLEQMVGRGVRLPDKNPLSTGKQDCLVIDFPWIVDDVHKLVHLTELFDDGSPNFETLQRAKELMEQGVSNPLDAHNTAIQEEQKRFKYLQFQRQNVTVTSFLSDPLNITRLFDDEVVNGSKEEELADPIDEEMVQVLHSHLEELKVPSPEKLTYTQGLHLYRILESRKQRHLCDPEQALELLKLGGDPEVINKMMARDAKVILKYCRPFQQVKEAISEISANWELLIYRELKREWDEKLAEYKKGHLREPANDVLTKILYYATDDATVSLDKRYQKTLMQLGMKELAKKRNIARISQLQQDEFIAFFHQHPEYKTNKERRLKIDEICDEYYDEIYDEYYEIYDEIYNFQTREPQQNFFELFDLLFLYRVNKEEIAKELQEVLNDIQEIEKSCLNHFKSHTFDKMVDLLNAHGITTEIAIHDLAGPEGIHKEEWALFIEKIESWKLESRHAEHLQRKLQFVNDQSRIAIIETKLGIFSTLRNLYEYERETSLKSDIDPNLDYKTAQQRLKNLERWQQKHEEYKLELINLTEWRKLDENDQQIPLPNQLKPYLLRIEMTAVELWDVEWEERTDDFSQEHFKKPLQELNREEQRLLLEKLEELPRESFLSKFSPHISIKDLIKDYTHG